MPPAVCPLCELDHLIAANLVIRQDAFSYSVISRDPINRYHVMVMPRRHFTAFVDLPPDLAAHLFLQAQQLSRAIRAVCRPDAITHISDDDLRGGWNLVSHYKLHLIPRYRSDRVRIDWSREPDPGDAARATWAAEVRQALRGVGHSMT